MGLRSRRCAGPDCTTRQRRRTRRLRAQAVRAVAIDAPADLAGALHMAELVRAGQPTERALPTVASPPGLHTLPLLGLRRWVPPLRAALRAWQPATLWCAMCGVTL